MATQHADGSWITVTRRRSTLSPEERERRQYLAEHLAETRRRSPIDAFWQDRRQEAERRTRAAMRSGDRRFEGMTEYEIYRHFMSSMSYAHMPLMLQGSYSVADEGTSYHVSGTSVETSEED